MSIFSYNIDGLNCLCAVATSSKRIAYVLYPMDNLGDWIATAAENYGITIVVVTGMAWDDDLTPWPASGVPNGCPDFGGHAAQFLSRLESLRGKVERKLKVSPTSRALVGVSLSGLFALWQWSESKLFRDIATLSGSYWYEGFLSWFSAQNYSVRRGGFAYILLGDKESHSCVKAFDSVGANTAEIVVRLKEQGVDVEFESVPGNHYQFPIERLNRAFDALSRH